MDIGWDNNPTVPSRGRGSKLTQVLCPQTCNLVTLYVVVSRVHWVQDTMWASKHNERDVVHYKQREYDIKAPKYYCVSKATADVGLCIGDDEKKSWSVLYYLRSFLNMGTNNWEARAQKGLSHHWPGTINALTRLLGSMMFSMSDVGSVTGWRNHKLRMWCWLR